MPVSIDVWRMRVGKFKMPPSKLSRKLGQLHEWQSDVSAPPASVLIYLLVTLVTGVHLVVNQPCTQDIHVHANDGFEMDGNHSFIPYLRMDLLLAGDVETNPGPAPLFSKDDLQALKTGEELVEKPSPLLNKHIIQLNQLKKHNKSITWGDVMLWLAQLMDKQVTELPRWSAIQVQWNRMKIEKLSLGKSIRQFPEKLEEWEESQYKLPVPKGPIGPRKSITSPSLSDMQALHDANLSLAKEVKQLAEEKDTLMKERPSPHKLNVMTRKEKRHQKLIRKQHNSLKKLNFELQSKDKRLSSLKKKKRSLSLERDRLQMKNRKLDEPKPQDPLEEQLKTAQNHILELQEVNAKLQHQLNKKESTVVSLMTQNHKGHPCYSAEARLCVYQLLSLHIGFDNVGKAINAVLGLVGKKADQLPSGRTVSHMNDERLLISQRQMQELADKPNLTLGTDETPKEGDIYMTYTLNDDDKSYVLGLREIVSKSAEDTLSTLKVILDDITEICDEVAPDSEMGNTGKKILCQIKNTMSDRASTEAKFNDVLKTYRESCLPLYKDGWDKFSNSAKKKLIEMNNFFCGLHLLVSMAETISKTYKNFEKVQLGEDRVGATSLPGVRIFSSDSGSMRLVRNACKALAKGADEKSGCHRAWKSYMLNNGINKRYLQNFRGNRFNIVFLLGGCVFHLRDRIFDFFHNVHGQTNSLLKAVHADIQVPLFLAGCKVLGILNKMITAPLWRVTEDTGHILDMCDHYTKLDMFLDSLTNSDENLAKFVRCESSCFLETLITKDEIFDSLAKPWVHDDLVIAMMHHTLVALKQLVSRVTVDYLPGGKFNMKQGDKEYEEDTKSSPKHNKLPERVFGYLGFLLGKRPNSSAIANEAQVMFVFNKTAEFISSLPLEKMEKLVSEAMSTSKDLREKMKERDQQRQQELIKRQTEKQKKREMSEKNKVKRKEDLTCVIIDAGLWQTRGKVNEKMNECTSEKEKFEACKKQIQFRREVLNQYIEEDKKFNFSVKGQAKSWGQLRDHLFCFIDAALSVSEGQSVPKTTPDQESYTIPLLVSKRVIHSFDTDDKEKTAYVGKVVSQVPGFPDWFNIVYDNDDAVYSYRLVDDYRDGNLEIIP